MRGNTIFAVWINENTYMSSDSKKKKKNPVVKQQTEILEESLSACPETLTSTKLRIPACLNALDKD